MGRCGAAREIEHREHGVDGLVHLHRVKVVCTDPPHEGPEHYDETLGLLFSTDRL